MSWLSIYQDCVVPFPYYILVVFLRKAYLREQYIVQYLAFVIEIFVGHQLYISYQLQNIAVYQSLLRKPFRGKRMLLHMMIFQIIR